MTRFLLGFFGACAGRKVTRLGAVVTIVGRSSERLARARENLGTAPVLRTVSADATREDEYRARKGGP